MIHALLGERGTTVCRGCRGTTLASVLDLGEQPLSNEMGVRSDQDLERFPLHLRICRSCGLGQVGEVVLADRIFGDNYPYLSSTSVSWVQHARRYAEALIGELNLTGDHLVLEIASNDGYLLSSFRDEGVRILGVEPARNVAAMAVQAGIPTLNEFFGVSAARRIVAGHGHPRLVVANNVMAHVPDLEDFVGGIAALIDDSSVITVENPSLVKLLLERQFDTIYHEHFSYLTALAVRTVARQHGLQLFRVQELETHGGSNRYWMRRDVGVAPEPSVEATIEAELAAGLLEERVWAEFAEASHAAIDGLRQWLDEQTTARAMVAGYGAAAKGNTLLNAAGATCTDLAYVVDGSIEKQGRFLPGSGVPVHAPHHLADEQPDHVLVLPWNLAAEIVPLVADQAGDACVWVAIPEMTRLR
ncbi:MAG TPA: class I SAM-dependent methyltransferase [Nocardioides sp.]|uniref:class I SAM-dependent methyltransferase n=1 Tax=Nocardioides sp. TaxID=35761 RepID=UPI002F411316